MARVPVSSGPRVQAAPLEQQRFRAADDGGGVAGAIGEGAQRLGQAGVNFAEQQDRNDELLDEAATKQLDNEAVTRMRGLLWTGDNAYFSTRGFDAANARKPTEQALADLRTELIGRTTTNRQRRMFAEQYDGLVARELEGIARHSIGQIAQEEERQSVARQVVYADDAVTHADDPVRFEQGVQTGETELRTRADRGGWAPEVLEAELLKYRSGIRARVAEAKVRSDPVGALAYVEQHAGELLPDDETKLRDSLYEPMLERKAEAIVDSYTGVGDAASPLPPVEVPAASMPRMVAITEHSESGSREYNADGSRVTSKAGARGIMQIMPATARKPGYGIKPSDGSPVEDRRVGRELLGKLVERYRGDPAKAWAAYNWGASRVDAAVARHGKNWLSHAPSETRGYVATNVRLLGDAGPGSEPRYAPRRDDLAGLYSYIDGRSDLTFDEKQAARRAADGRVSRNDALLTRQRRDADEQVDRYLDDPNVRSFSAIPPAVLRQASPGTRRQLQAEFDRRNAPEPRRTDYGFLTRLSDAYGSDRAAFLALNPVEARARLSDGDYEQYLGWRRDAMKPAKGGKSRQQVEHSRILNVSRDALGAAGVITGDTKDARKPEHAERRGRFVNGMSQMVREWQAVHGAEKVPGDDDLKGMAAGLLMDMATNDDKLLFELTDQEVSAQMNPTDRQRIARALQGVGVPATPANVAAAYRRTIAFVGRNAAGAR